MAVRLVDRLEVIDVEHHDADVPALVAAAGPRLQQIPGRGQSAPVDGLRQRIERRRAGQLPGQLAVGQREQCERRQQVQHRHREPSPGGGIAGSRQRVPDGRGGGSVTGREAGLPVEKAQRQRQQAAGRIGRRQQPSEAVELGAVRPPADQCGGKQRDSAEQVAADDLDQRIRIESGELRHGNRVDDGNDQQQPDQPVAMADIARDRRHLQDQRDAECQVADRRQRARGSRVRKRHQREAERCDQATAPPHPDRIRRGCVRRDVEQRDGDHRQHGGGGDADGSLIEQRAGHRPQITDCAGG